MQEISDKMGNHQYARVNVCCMDCGREFDIVLERTGPDQIEIKSGVIGKRDGEYLFKCPECFKEDQNFGQNCEIYSRVVGNIRPVKRWKPARMFICLH